MTNSAVDNRKLAATLNVPLTNEHPKKSLKFNSSPPACRKDKTTQSQKQFYQSNNDNRIIHRIKPKRMMSARPSRNRLLSVNDPRSKSVFGARVVADKWKELAKQHAAQIYKGEENKPKDKWSEYVRQLLAQEQEQISSKMFGEEDGESKQNGIKESQNKSKSESDDEDTDDDVEDEDEREKKRKQKLIKNLRIKIQNLKIKSPSSRKKVVSESEDEDKSDKDDEDDDGSIKDDDESDNDSDENEDKVKQFNASDTETDDNTSKQKPTEIISIENNKTPLDFSEEEEEEVEKVDLISSKVEPAKEIRNTIDITSTNNKFSENLSDSVKEDNKELIDDEDNISYNENVEIDEEILNEIIPLGCPMIDLKKQIKEIRKRSIVTVPKQTLQTSLINSNDTEIDNDNLNTAIDDILSLKDNIPKRKVSLQKKDSLQQLEKSILNEYEQGTKLRGKKDRKRSHQEVVDGLLTELQLNV